MATRAENSSKIPKIVWNGNDLDFDFPLHNSSDFLNKPKAIGTSTRTEDGGMQTIVNFIDYSFKLDFRLITESKLADIEEFVIEWAFFGNTFEFYPDKDEVDFFTLQLTEKGRNFKPEEVKGIPKVVNGSLEFLCRVTLDCVRVVV